MNPIRLLLVDDHTLFRESLSRLLASEPDFQVVATAGTPSDALQMLSLHAIDLLLLDYDLGESNGLDFINQVRAAGFARRVFIITAGMSDAESVRALSLGVCGIFLKHGPPATLTEAIRKVMNGETWIDQRCIQSLVRAVGTAGEQPRHKPLTERESAVLKGVFEGLSNKEIGALLNISEASVKSALQQLFVKTGVRTRSQLVRVALEEHASLWGSRT